VRAPWHDPFPAAEAAADAAAHAPVPGRGPAAGALALAIVLGRADAPLLGALAGGIRADLWVTDVQLGALAAALALARAAALPASTRLAVRLGPARLASAGLAAAGGAALLAAAAPGFALLLLACLALGAGRAAPGALAAALAAPARAAGRSGRSAALAAAALPSGAALGYGLAALAPWLGWRAPIALSAALALGAAAALRLLRGRAGAAARPGAPAEAPPPAAFVPIALAPAGPGGPGPGRSLALAGEALLAFALGALVFWAPAFLERARGVPPGVAASQLAAIAVMAALAAPAAGRLVGLLPARLAPAAWAGREGAAAAACLLGAALAWSAVVAPSPAIYLPALALTVPVLLAARRAVDGPARPGPRPATPSYRGGRRAALLAGGLAPAALGGLSELTSLYWSFLAVPAAALLAGAALAAAAYARGRSR